MKEYLNTNKKVWEDIYMKGNQMNKYPYDDIVTFLYRNSPKNIDRKNIKILEVGCGAGNNLWFAAREGFNVTGIDISESAINYVRKRFEKDNLQGNFIVGNFIELPFKDEEFDLIIDRAGLTYLSFDDCKNAMNEINRILKVNGMMYFNPFSEKHSSCASGIYMENGMITNIKDGISGCGNTCFYGRRDIYNLLSDSWKIESLKHCECVEELNSYHFTEAQWRVVLKKVRNENE